MAYSGGTGTSSDPYLIGNLTDLQNINQNSSSYFKLTSDILIDFNDTWNMINSFSGVLDGNEYKVTFNRNLGDGVDPFRDFALFNQVSGIVKNLKINGRMNLVWGDGISFVAVDLLQGGLIENIVAEVEFYSTFGSDTFMTSDGLAGLVVNSQGIIRHCKVNILAKRHPEDTSHPDTTDYPIDSISPICNSMSSPGYQELPQFDDGAVIGGIYECEASGEVYGGTVSGLVNSVEFDGYSFGFENCFSDLNLNIIGRNGTGAGLIDSTRLRQPELTGDMVIENCVFVGNIKTLDDRSISDSIAGLVEKFAGNCEFISCYYNSDKVNYPSVPTGTTYATLTNSGARTTSELTEPFDPSTYVNWNFNSIWKYINSEKYPVIFVPLITKSQLVKLSDKELFYPKAGSPEVTITEILSADETTAMSVDNVENLPDAPNIITLFDSESFESIIYEEIDKNNSQLLNLERGVDGTVKEWPIGTSASRLFTAEDQTRLLSFIKEIELVLKNNDMWRGFKKITSLGRESFKGYSNQITGAFSINITPNLITNEFSLESDVMKGNTQVDLFINATTFPIYIDLITTADGTSLIDNGAVEVTAAGVNTFTLNSAAELIQFDAVMYSDSGGTTEIVRNTFDIKGATIVSIDSVTDGDGWLYTTVNFNGYDQVWGEIEDLTGNSISAAPQPTDTTGDNFWIDFDSAKTAGTEFKVVIYETDALINKLDEMSATVQAAS